MMGLIWCIMACTGAGGSSTATEPSGGTGTPNIADTGPYPTTPVNVLVWEEDRNCWALWQGMQRRADWWGPWWENDVCHIVDDGNEGPRFRYWLADEGLCMEVENPLVDECFIPDPAIEPCEVAPIECCGRPARLFSWCSPVAYEP